MLKNISLLLLLFTGFTIKAKNDSLDYKIKLYTGFNCTFTTVKYSEKTISVSRSMSDNLTTSSSTVSSSYNGTNKIQSLLLPEFNIDFQLPKHFKIVLGLFFNKINFKTPIISSTDKEEDYGYTFQSMQNYTLTSTSTLYSSGPTHVDNINLFFLGTSLGTGYTFNKKRFYFDLDAGLKILFLLNDELIQTYDYNSYYDSNTTTYNLGDKKDQRDSHSTKIAAYYLKGAISYRLSKSIYFNVGASYTCSFIPLHGSFSNDSENDNYFTYSFNIQQFVVNAGFALKVK